MYRYLSPNLPYQINSNVLGYFVQEFGNIEEILQEWTEEEKEDPVTFFVNKDEYRKLTKLKEIN